MAKKIDIGKLDSCLIVVDYNSYRSDDCDIRFYKDRNEAKKKEGIQRNFLIETLLQLRILFQP